MTNPANFLPPPAEPLAEPAGQVLVDADGIVTAIFEPSLMPQSGALILDEEAYAEVRSLGGIGRAQIIDGIVWPVELLPAEDPPYNPAGEFLTALLTVMEDGTVDVPLAAKGCGGAFEVQPGEYWVMFLGELPAVDYGVRKDYENPGVPMYLEIERTNAWVTIRCFDFDTRQLRRPCQLFVSCSR